jgi:TPR repeat protein
MIGVRWLAVAALLLAAAPVHADYAIGLIAYHNGDFANALTEFEKSVDDDPRAMVALGIMVARGEGTDKDMAKAADWFGRAAAAGEPAGQYQLGRLHYSGAGVALDKARAAALFGQAAVQQHVGAIQALSLMLESGDGVPADLPRALELARLNADVGVPRDQVRLAQMYAEGRGAEADPAEAYFWMALAARTGLPEAQAAFEEYGTKLTEAQRGEQDERALKWRPAGEYKP